MAFLFLRDKYLGRVQGKHNVLKFFDFFCVNEKNNIERFAYYSRFKSSSIRRNNIIYHKYAILTKFGSSHSKTAGSEEYRKKLVTIEKSERMKKFLQLQLIRGGVHPNPGPQGKENNLTFVTYNCRGLKEISKLRRLMSKINKLVEQNHIVALQETHKVDERALQIFCKQKFFKNCEFENRAGVMVFFGNDYECSEVIMDKESRYIIVAIENEVNKFVVGNVYFPNDNREAIRFGEEYYNKLIQVQSSHPEYYTVSMGDYNTCFKSEDYISRLTSKKELELVKSIEVNNDASELVDAYRTMHKEGGFTWNRGKCFSRLDYIFVAKYMIGTLVSAELDWCLDSSDHAAVKCQFKFERLEQKGPGIARLNTKLLENDNIKEEIIKEISELETQVDVSWNPHVKLEFMKMSVRSAFSNAASKVNKSKRDEIEELEIQINRLRRYKEEMAMGNQNEEKKVQLEEILVELMKEIEIVRNKFSEDVAFKAGAKWYEEGEKSNKYFLGLLKMRTKQKMITNILDGEKVIKSKDGIIEYIRNFYAQLYSKNSENKDRIVDESFFDEYPKLSTKNKDELDRNITLEELSSTLKYCKESSPGPDGITYKVYKELWNILGKYIVESWNYSVSSGNLPPSHKESVLTLLPKEGKDLRLIKNWRPITLTNCDSKIITKALANRLSKVLKDIIHPSQTAYIPDRSVMDNLRSNFYTKNYCEKHKLDATLISLDAKKAFDSVDHQYIRNVLKEYGFGERFIGYFNTLYKDLQVRILVNGFFSEVVKIERGVKQGDALSCSLFILCMDPLIRNINKNNKIEGIKFKSKKADSDVEVKCSGYADDVAVICLNKEESIREVFKEYERLTRKSGLELNADKTEILQLGGTVDRHKIYEFEYLDTKYALTSVERIKICGLYFCTDKNEEYEENIMEKVERLESQLKRWMCRNLTLEGKILIVKTYGLSQLIYNLQCYHILENEIRLVERLVFKFIWAKKWESKKVIDRIRRSVLKNEYNLGGLRAPDIECLDKALKLKQFIRTSGSSHIMGKLQEISMESLGYDSVIKQEYSRISGDDYIIKVGQEAINLLTDWSRRERYGTNENGQSSSIAINTVGSINISEYLRRSGKEMANCIFSKIKAEGIECLNEVIMEMEFTKDITRQKNLKYITMQFPPGILEIANNYNGEINRKEGDLNHFYLGEDIFVPVKDITVKSLQAKLKIAGGKVEIVKYEDKLHLEEFDRAGISEVRKKITNVKLRQIFYRLINNDFYTKVRMLRFKMVENNECERCGQEETTRHLLWECWGAQKAWKGFNDILGEKGIEVGKVNDYKDIYNYSGTAVISTIKLKIVNELIQIERPKNLNVRAVERIIEKLKNTEKYIAIKNKKEINFYSKWTCFA